VSRRPPSKRERVGADQLQPIAAPPPEAKTDAPRAPTILDQLRPVGAEPPALAAISIGEKRRRAKRTKAQHAATGQSPQAGSGKPRSVSKRTPLTHGEALELVSDVARRSYDAATSKTETANARKNAAVGLAVSVDKWAMLTQRPVAPATSAQDDVALLALGAKLAQRGCPRCGTR
jgi:hypothetical protein